MRRQFFRHLRAHVVSSYRAFGRSSAHYHDLRAEATAREFGTPVRMQAAAGGDISLSMALFFGGAAWVFLLGSYGAAALALLNDRLTIEDQFVVSMSPVCTIGLGFISVCFYAWPSPRVRALRPKPWRVARLLSLHSLTVGFGLVLALSLLLPHR